MSGARCAWRHRGEGTGGCSVAAGFLLQSRCRVSSLVVFNYIHSLVTSLQNESSLMAMAMMCREPVLGFDRILLLDEAVLAEMGERK